jgi:hypothetical protein
MTTKTTTNHDEPRGDGGERRGDETGCHIAAHINNDNDKWRQRMSRNDEAVVTKEGPLVCFLYIYFFSFAFIFVN